MQTLRVIMESRIEPLFSGASQARRLEASGVLAHEDDIVIVFDNVDRVARIAASLSEGEICRWEQESTRASGHEDIAFNPHADRYYLLVETIPVAGGGYQSVIVEVDRDFVPQAQHQLPFAFVSDNKGFEGLAVVHRDGHEYLLALCEGNRCRSGAAGRKKGKGRIQIFRRDGDGWTHAGRLKLPPAVRFTDYASLDIKEDRVAILSQESSQIWLGALHPTKWAFVDDGHIWQLPLDAQGRVNYCNAEGIAWITPERLVIVSDKRKKGSPKRCARKDQSIHLIQVEDRPPSGVDITANEARRSPLPRKRRSANK